MKKKIIVFILPILMVGLVSGLLLDYYGVISKNVTVEKAITIDGIGCVDEICTESSGVIAGGESVVSNVYTISSHTSVNAPLSIDTATDPIEEGIESEVEFNLQADSIVWGEDGYLSADFEAGREVITILVEEMTLGDLDLIDFEQYVKSGYPASVNILLDINGDGVFESKKDLTTGYLTDGEDEVLKVEFAYNGATAGYPDAYMLEEDYNTWSFEGVGVIDDTTQAWIYSVIAGGEDIIMDTLANFKIGINRGTSCYYVDTEWKEEACDDFTINSATKVYGIQIENLGWISAGDSLVKDIHINEDPVEPTLLPEDSLRFDVVTTFGLGNSGTYNLVSTINAG